MMQKRITLAIMLVLWTPMGAVAQEVPSPGVAAVNEVGRSVLRAGTVIPGMLITGVNSDLAGDIIAQVTRDVYDFQQKVLLIPRGSRLIGTYGDQVAAGQNRLLVVWTMLQMPDGRSYQLPGINGTDREGAAGVEGGVNNHYRSVFGSAIMMALFGAGVNIANPVPPAGFGQQQLTPQQEIQKQVALEINQVGVEMLRRNARVQPTITVPKGKPFLVLINRDIALPPWTEPAIW